MKIYGIGIDIVNTNRIARSLKQKKIIKRLFNNEEIVKCAKLINKESCYAKRFAAKEAFSKAIGTGISKGINFNEIIVINNSKGKPNIKLIGKTKIVIDKIIKKKFNVLLTLSDDKPFAIATVIISLWKKKELLI